MRTSSAVALVLTLVPWSALACRVPAESPSGIPEELTERTSADRVARGAQLFADHCAVCHGSQGRADGPAARFLFPPARDFTRGRFELVSSTNGVPFDRDLVATLRRGVPGSAMPGWSWLAEPDLWALAAHVRALAIAGVEADLTARARSSGDELLLADAASIARERLTPERPLYARGAAPLDAPTLAHGRRVFLEHCAQCHAADGTGEPAPLVDEDGTMNWARDFTAGFFEGGDSPAELTWRIRAGMPGTAMPPTALVAEDEAALIAFVRSLIPAGTAQRLVHTRATLRGQRTARVPLDPDDPAWNAADEVDVVLAPLWWSDEAVLGASLSAVHDGETLALRLRWPDETGDVRLFSEGTTTDAAALQLSGEPRVALFGMGAPGHPTNLWHWQALRVEDASAALELLDLAPHAARPTQPGEVRPDVPLYRRLLGRLEPSSDAARITVEGVSSVGSAPRFPGEVAAHARWHAGEWSVVFSRALAPGTDQVPLRPGSTVQIACAVWNGAAGDDGAKKSISIWQELVLEP